MVIFYIIILVLALWKLTYKINGFYDDYLNKEQCNAIKGIFILTVFVRHCIPYLIRSGYESSSWLFELYNVINGFLGQLIVVMFLFYSGYGVMESIKQKGNGYLKSFPKKRILGTLLNFDVAVICFLVMDTILGLHYPTSQICLSIIAWESIGNSAWYIFVILLCYLFTFLCFYKSRDYKKSCWVLLISLFSSMIVLSYIKEIHWYCTILCFPLGVIFSLYKDYIEKMLKKQYALIFLSLGVSFILLHYGPIPDFRGVSFNLRGGYFQSSLL